MARRWIADRAHHFDASGIRKVFDLAAKMANPINLSIGQPDFPVPSAIKQAAIKAIDGDRNGYALTQGIPELREKLAARVHEQFPHDDRQLMVTSGTSGGLLLAMLSLINPGDEVIVFDPYFVMYPSLVKFVGGTAVVIDTYPDFQVDVDRVAAAITPRTKVILFNCPANPTGVMASPAQVKALAELAAKHDILLISDEIYRLFCYDSPFVSPAQFNPQTLVIDGFSKTYGMTGWRVGFAHGPSEIIQQMTKMQQYTFVCAPQPFQWAAATAMDVDMASYAELYRRKRDLLFDGLKYDYQVVKPEGAFYMFPQVPWGTGTEFVTQAIENELLVIPGNIFSGRDTHFRISFAASQATLARGIDVLRRLARKRP